MPLPASHKQKQKPVRTKTINYGKSSSAGAEAASIANVSSVSTWSVSGTSQWRYPTNIIIHSAAQLKQLQQFLFGKVCCILENVLAEFMTLVAAVDFLINLEF